MVLMAVLSGMLVLFFNDTATTEIYTLSLHDALPICRGRRWRRRRSRRVHRGRSGAASSGRRRRRSEEHTSELQSRQYLVCRLLLEKKRKVLMPLLSQLLTPAAIMTMPLFLARLTLIP